ncbi:MAG: hypothetical protein PHC62_07645 [Candidatus Izemoplasmatales bacterium]|jgi:hypothetical protein|nr:hypothetical protein [Candidatus Izemoplasmatales bacterium]
MKRITFLTGYYGSGKSEIALNLAISEKVDYLVDLDIINPYFRSREMEKLLQTFQIQVISSDQEHGMYTDLPYISGRVFMPFHMKDTKAIYDLGGNDLGSKLLIQFQELSESIDLFIVINIFRYETSTPEQIIELISKIEDASGRKVTGLINNSNLIHETTFETILEGEKILKKVVKATGLKIQYTCVHEDINIDGHTFEGKLLPLKIYLRKNWY